MDNAQQAAGVPENPMISLQLPLQLVNLALVGLAKLPGEVCIPAIEEIKRQSYAHIATLKAQAEASQQAAATDEGATVMPSASESKASRAVRRRRPKAKA